MQSTPVSAKIKKKREPPRGVYLFTLVQQLQEITVFLCVRGGYFLFMAMMNPVASTKKRSTSYKVISPPPFPFRIRGEEVAAVAFGDSLMGII